MTGDEIGCYCVCPHISGKPTANIELPPWAKCFRSISTRHNGPSF